MVPRTTCCSLFTPSMRCKQFRSRRPLGNPHLLHAARRQRFAQKAAEDAFNLQTGGSQQAAHFVQLPVTDRCLWMPTVQRRRGGRCPPCRRSGCGLLRLKASRPPGWRCSAQRRRVARWSAVVSRCCRLRKGTQINPNRHRKAKARMSPHTQTPSTGASHPSPPPAPRPAWPPSDPAPPPVLPQPPGSTRYDRCCRRAPTAADALPGPAGHRTPARPADPAARARTRRRGGRTRSTIDALATSPLRGVGTTVRAAVSIGGRVDVGIKEARLGGTEPFLHRRPCDFSVMSIVLSRSDMPC